MFLLSVKSLFVLSCFASSVFVKFPKGRHFFLTTKNREKGQFERSPFLSSSKKGLCLFGLLFQ